MQRKTASGAGSAQRCREPELTFGSKLMHEAACHMEEVWGVTESQRDQVCFFPESYTRTLPQETWLALTVPGAPTRPTLVGLGARLTARDDDNTSHSISTRFGRGGRQ